MFISHFKSLSGKARHQQLLTHDREGSFTTEMGKRLPQRSPAPLAMPLASVLVTICLLLEMVQNAITTSKSKRITLTLLSSNCVGSNSRRVISPSLTTPNFSVRRRMMPSPPSKAAFPLALPAPLSAPYGHAHHASCTKSRKEQQDSGIDLVIGIMLFGSDIYSLFPLYSTMAILVITYAILFLPYTAEYVASA